MGLSRGKSYRCKSALEDCRRGGVVRKPISRKAEQQDKREERTITRDVRAGELGVGLIGNG